VSIAPAVAPDLPLSPPLPELFAPLLVCAELFVPPLDFADVSAAAGALALLFECEDLSDCVPDVVLAPLLPPPLLEELDELEELDALDELIDLPPPVAASELPEEGAAF